MRQLKFLPQSTTTLVQLVLFLISMFLVDITHTSESASAFSSANKVRASPSLQSPSSQTSANRHKRRVTDEAAFFGDDSDAEQALEVLKRAPGWGKRFYEGDALEAVEKRAPGWGKRSDFQEDDEDSEVMDKRAPGWGKRAPGWGKRAPGWGKRAPGWGKRAPGWGKRAPGWGKRAPGWGKRAPGWGKRSDNSEQCNQLDAMIENFKIKVREAEVLREVDCGNQEAGK